MVGRRQKKNAIFLILKMFMIRAETGFPNFYLNCAAVLVLFGNFDI